MKKVFSNFECFSESPNFNSAWCRGHDTSISGFHPLTLIVAYITMIFFLVSFSYIFMTLVLTRITFPLKFTKLTEGCVMISSSWAKQLKTDKATDWNINLGQPSGLSLLLNIRAKKEYPIPFIKLNLASLLHSVPLTNLGTRNRVANFSVSVSAASRARMHFRTFSEKKKVFKCGELASHF